MNIPKGIIWGALIIIFFTLITVGVTSIWLDLEFIEQIALGQLIFSILAFGLFIFTLFFAYERYRKSIAKPELSLSFSENGVTEATLDTHHNMDSVQTFDLWVLNTGNKVANVLQVELDIPDEFNPHFRHISKETRPIPHRFSIKGETRTISFYATDKYYFVGVPSRVIAFELETHSEYEYPSSFTIPYRAFGDWGETQKGELEVACIKQKEAIDAHS